VISNHTRVGLAVVIAITLFPLVAVAGLFFAVMLFAAAIVAVFDGHWAEGLLGALWCAAAGYGLLTACRVAAHFLRTPKPIEPVTLSQWLKGLAVGWAAVLSAPLAAAADKYAGPGLIVAVLPLLPTIVFVNILIVRERKLAQLAEGGTR
jgi:hypothetical protein